MNDPRVNAGALWRYVVPVAASAMLSALGTFFATYGTLVRVEERSISDGKRLDNLEIQANERTAAVATIGAKQQDELLTLQQTTARLDRIENKLDVVISRSLR